MSWIHWEGGDGSGYAHYMVVIVRESYPKWPYVIQVKDLE